MDVKQVGKRKAAKGLEAASRLLQLVLDLRGAKPFHPKGVYRFKTFEEAQKSFLEFITRRNLIK